MLPELSKLPSPSQTWEFPCYDFCGSDIMYQETQGQPPCFRKNLVGGKGQEYSGGGRRNLGG